MRRKKFGGKPFQTWKVSLKERANIANEPCFSTQGGKKLFFGCPIPQALSTASTSTNLLHDELSWRSGNQDYVYFERMSKMGEEEKPPYDGKELGDDPTKCPGPGFEWKGTGIPESGKGSWYNKETREHLHPDLDHPPPEKPHWDYIRPDKKQYRLAIIGAYDDEGYIFWEKT